MIRFRSSQRRPRLMRMRIAHALFGLLMLADGAPAEQPQGDSLSFDATVAPILARRCLDCHSGSDPKGKLDLSKQVSALAGGKSGPAIMPGKVDDSIALGAGRSGRDAAQGAVARERKGCPPRMDRRRCKLGHRSDRPLPGDDQPPGRPRLVVASARASAKSAAGTRQRLGANADRRVRATEAGSQWVSSGSRGRETAAYPTRLLRPDGLAAHARRRRRVFKR